ncbi:insulinase family protein [Nocardioidaceae bacterium]|nr:insulinase family protein [Nocardioidaceae bacterium]
MIQLTPLSTQTLLESTDDDGAVLGRVRRSVLPGGLRVITESVPGVRSAAVGVWVAAGSRDETPALNGASHFLEHLLFKGTRERSAWDISVQLDEVGGEMNAFTAKESTCFHARVLDRDLPVAIDVLGDMMTASAFTAADVEAEREVILDEIAMHDDDPDDVAHNLFAAHAFGDSPLGRPVAGTHDSISAMSREQIRRYYRSRYTPSAMVVSVAGNVDHDEVVDLVARAFSRAGFLEQATASVPQRRTSVRRRMRAGTVRSSKGFEQVNLVLGFPGLPRGDRRRHTLGVLDAALGGGTSSRLFQEVRERRGLAYSVFSFASHYTDTGIVGVGAGCLPTKVEPLLAVVRDQLADMARGGVTSEEVERGKGQLRGGIVLGLEDTASRMFRNGKTELVGEDLLGVEALIERIDSVTVEDVTALAAEVFSRPETLAVVGPA